LLTSNVDMLTGENRALQNELIRIRSESDGLRSKARQDERTIQSLQLRVNYSTPQLPVTQNSSGANNGAPSSPHPNK